MTGDTAAERAVTQALAALPEGWTVLDHVVVGPAGVFVVEGLHWPGTITAHDGELRQDGESRHATVREAQQDGEDVRRRLPALDPRLVQPVLCFAGPTPGRARIAGVLVCTVETLVAELLSLPALLDELRVAGLADELRGRRAVAVPAAGHLASRVRHRSAGRAWLLAGLALGLLGAAAVVLALVVGPALFGGDDDTAGDSGHGSHQPVDHRQGGPTTPGGHGAADAAPRADVVGHLGDLGSGLSGMFGSAPVAPHPARGHGGAAVRQHAR